MEILFLWHLYTFVDLELIIMQDKMMLQSDFSVLEIWKIHPPPQKGKNLWKPKNYTQYQE